VGAIEDDDLIDDIIDEVVSMSSMASIISTNDHRTNVEVDPAFGL
jgi:hypothetical protein